MIEKLDQNIKSIIKSGQVNVPVHIVPIAEKFGLKVFKNKTFPDTLSGLIKKVGESYEIHVNGNHPITRQRFTMAHELAHFLLHKEEIGDGVTDDALYRSSLTNRIEREANLLAAEILMPEHLLKTDKYGGMTISEQADEFWVSRISMDIRLGQIL